MDFAGRPMKGYIYVSPDGQDPAGVQKWVGMALDFVVTLPAKAKKEKTKATK